MRRLFALAVFGCLAVGCGDDVAVQAPGGPPNVVVLFCDDAGYGDFSCAGHPTIKTPEVDRMAAEGLVFTQFCSASSACTASRYGLLTGRHPYRSGFGWVLYPKSLRSLHEREITVAEALREKGYATALVGKWHLGFPNEENEHDGNTLPLAHGFDRYFGLPYSNDMRPPKWPKLPLLEGPAPDASDAIPGYRTVALDPDQSTLTRRYTEEAIRFIESHEASPFFLLLAYAMPHVPLHPGEAFAGRSLRGTYGDVIEEIDWSVGRILATLRERGLDRRTLVLFTSDNGPWILKGSESGSAGPFRDGKGSTWEGGLRVPGVAWWPGTIQAGRRTAAFASTLDVLPTAVALAGGTAPDDRVLDGRDLGPLLRGDGKPPARPFFYGGPGQSQPHAVRAGRHKLHLRTNSQTRKQYGWPNVSPENPLLFDLEADPGERYDIAAEHPDVVKRLRRLVEAFESEVRRDGTYWD